MLSPTRFAVLLAATLVATVGVVAQRPADGNAPAIHLKATTFRPTLGEAPVIPDRLMRADFGRGERGYYLVQFAGPILEEWKAAVRAQGAELLDYIPDFAFKVRMTPETAAQVRRVSGVGWVGVFHPAYTLDGPPAQETALYEVTLERGSDTQGAMAALGAAGARLVRGDRREVLVLADGFAVEAMAQVLDVAAIRRYVMPEKHNDAAATIIGATTAHARTTGAVNGAGEIIAVADSGIGDGTATGAHAAIASSRIAGILNRPGASDTCLTVTDDGAKDVNSGHGTHTATTAVGAGVLDSAGALRAKGIAPGATLLFQAMENWATPTSSCSTTYRAGYYLTGIPSVLSDLFAQAYALGARVHSNSWGSAANGAYTANSVSADQFVWSNRDMTITFSAGNAGVDVNADGVVDNDSMSAPATAKNVISVGASENARTDSYPCDFGKTIGGMYCGGTNAIYRYSAWNSTTSSRFPVNPLRDDFSAGNPEQMAAFSSRGPTDDLRIKPDVVAPGTWVLSGYSNQHRETYDGINPQTGGFQGPGWGIPRDGATKYNGGTSMSNPMVAGGAALVRQHLKSRGFTNPTAALVKAVLINTAVDIKDENNDGANDNDFPIPNAHEGWGRVDLNAATDGRVNPLEESTTWAMTTGLARTFTSSWTGAAGTPLKVTLVWTDPASTSAATRNLVNDLDLEVKTPSGTIYRGNRFALGWSATGTTVDRTNNVENVYLSAPVTGTYTITIKGYNVPSGPQPFALVVSGGSLTTPAPPPVVNAHIGDIDGVRSVGKSSWKPSATVLVHNATHGVVSGATVTGRWGTSTTNYTCTTSTAGTCTVAGPTLALTVLSQAFTVTNISGTNITYVATANHDVSTDTGLAASNGTTITVTQK